MPRRCCVALLYSSVQWGKSQRPGGILTSFPALNPQGQSISQAGPPPTLSAHPSPCVPPTHIRSRQILLLRSLLPIATRAAGSLLFCHTLWG